MLVVLDRVTSSLLMKTNIPCHPFPQCFLLFNMERKKFKK